MHDLSAFSNTYREARDKFLAAAAALKLPVQSYVHPLKGHEGEELALDVTLAGKADAKQLLIVSSAVHGVEGFCGSGVQVHALRDAAWAADHNSDIAVLYLHAINPYGFSHIRRATHENVDLNRNFQDFSKPLPVNLGYRELHPLLLPKTWPPTWINKAQTALKIATKGMPAVQAAVSGGQYEFADGLFYGGNAPTWSHLMLRQVLRDYARRASHIAWIDFHTGLGPSGHGERIYSPTADDAATYARASQWWSNEGRTPLTRHDNGSSISAPVVGTIVQCAQDELSHAQTTKITIEFGTVPPLRVLQAMRAEQWLQLHPDTPANQAAQIKRDMHDAFYTDTDEWKTQVLSQSLQAMTQAIKGLRHV